MAFSLLVQSKLACLWLHYILSLLSCICLLAGMEWWNSPALSVCLSLLSFFPSLSSTFLSLVSRSFGDILSLSSLSIHCLSVKRLGVLCNVTVSLKDKTGSDMNLLTYSSSPASLRPLSSSINPQPLASLSTVISVASKIQHFSHIQVFRNLLTHRIIPVETFALINT